MAAGLGAVQMLQKSLADAHKDLSSTNAALRRLTGRDPENPPLRPGPERRTSSGGRMRAWSGENRGGAPAAKRRDTFGSMSRLAGRLGPPPQRQGADSGGEDTGEADTEKKPSIQSSVVATSSLPRPKGPAQDEKSKKRNRRMFGFLMGTLQKFKESEEASKQSEKERRRSEIDERLQKEVELEREEAAKERRKLFEQRKSQKSKLARLAHQVATAEMYEEWIRHDQLVMGYIKTNAKPHIFYRPAKQTSKTEDKLKKTTAEIEAKIASLEKEMKTSLEEEQGGGGGGGDGEVNDSAVMAEDSSFLDQSMEIGEGEGEEEEKGEGREVRDRGVSASSETGDPFEEIALGLHV